MTPAEHAKVVEEWVRSRVSILDGPESRLEKSNAGRASLAELVAQAERAEAAEELTEALRWMANYKMTGSERTLHIDFQGKARAVLAADPETRPA